MLNDLKADLGQAYVRAVAHAAGFFVQESQRALDSDGVDLMILERGVRGVARSIRLDVQLKATAEPIREDSFPVDLSVKNYDELRAAGQVPSILVVVALPADMRDWVSATEQELIVRHCGYWHSLRGAEGSANATSVRVRIPRSSFFHVDQLQAIMERIRQGGHP
jgi:hypothetical protein